MKRYLMPILAILVLTSGLLLANCTGTVKVSSAERDKAVMFYKELYPAVKELQQVMDDWNSWNAQASQVEYESQIISKCDYFEAKLRVLASRVVALEATLDLVKLQDTTFSAINRRSEAFALMKQYALTGEESYYQKAESARLDSMKLMTLAAKEYDKGLSHYGIKPSEVVK